MRLLQQWSERYRFTYILAVSFVVSIALTGVLLLVLPVIAVIFLAGVVVVIYGVLLVLVTRMLYTVQSERHAITQELKMEMERKLTQQRQELIQRMRYERGTLIAALARRDSNRQLPRRALILLTVHRSGSTWLVDMLRCHPAIMLDPVATLMRALRIEGGRYPLGLADGDDADMAFENKPNDGIMIPHFDSIQLDLMDAEVYALDKIHPQFIDDDASTFFQKVTDLESQMDIQIQFVYLVRDPRSVLSSFLNYQRRDDDWYSWLPQSEVASFMARAYDTMTEFARLRPGVVVDYADLRNDPQSTLITICNHLWPDEQQATAAQFAQAAVERTARDKRQATNNTFLGKQEGRVAGGADQHEAFFTQYADTLDAIYASYQTLLDEGEKTS